MALSKNVLGLSLFLLLFYLLFVTTVKADEIYDPAYKESDPTNLEDDQDEKSEFEYDTLDQNNYGDDVQGQKPEDNVNDETNNDTFSNDDIATVNEESFGSNIQTSDSEFFEDEKVPLSQDVDGENIFATQDKSINEDNDQNSQESEEITTANEERLSTQKDRNKFQAANADQSQNKTKISDTLEKYINKLQQNRTISDEHNITLNRTRLLEHLQSRNRSAIENRNRAQKRINNTFNSTINNSKTPSDSSDKLKENESKITKSNDREIFDKSKAFKPEDNDKKVNGKNLFNPFKDSQKIDEIVSNGIEKGSRMNKENNKYKGKARVNDTETKAAEMRQQGSSDRKRENHSNKNSTKKPKQLLYKPITKKGVETLLQQYTLLLHAGNNCYHQAVEEGTMITLDYLDCQGYLVLVSVKDDEDTILQKSTEKSRGTIIVHAEKEGLYHFCFHNPFWTTRKLFVSFQVTPDAAKQIQYRKNSNEGTIYLISEKAKEITALVRLQKASSYLKDYKQNEYLTTMNVQSWFFFAAVLTVLLLQVFAVHRIFYRPPTAQSTIPFKLRV